MNSSEELERIVVVVVVEVEVVDVVDVDVVVLPVTVKDRFSTDDELNVMLPLISVAA
jgi:hypothetical protein